MKKQKHEEAEQFTKKNSAEGGREFTGVESSAEQARPGPPYRLAAGSLHLPSCSVLLLWLSAPPPQHSALRAGQGPLPI